MERLLRYSAQWATPVLWTDTSELSSASRRGKGSGHHSGERGLDCWNSDADRCSSKHRPNGCGAQLLHGCNSLRTLDTTRRSDAERRRRPFSEYLGLGALER